MKDKYPEHTKLKAVQEESRKLGAFLEWLETERMEICDQPNKYDNRRDYTPINLSIEKLLARYFGVDLKRLEKEKQVMLEEQRKLNEADKEWSDETPPWMQ